MGPSRSVTLAAPLVDAVEEEAVVQPPPMVSGHAPWDIPVLTPSEALACGMANKQRRQAESQIRQDQEKHRRALEGVLQLSRGSERDRDTPAADAAAGDVEQDIMSATARRASDAIGTFHATAAAAAAAAASTPLAASSLRIRQRRASATPGPGGGLRRSATAASQLPSAAASRLSLAAASSGVEHWNGVASLSALASVTMSGSGGRAAKLSRPMLASARDKNAASLPQDIDSSIARIVRSRAGKLGGGLRSTLSSTILPAIGPSPRVLGGGRCSGDPSLTVEVLSAVVHNAVLGDTEEAIKIIDEATSRGRRSRSLAGGRGGGGGGSGRGAGAGGADASKAMEGGGTRVDRPLAQVWVAFFSHPHRRTVCVHAHEYTPHRCANALACC